MNITLSQDVANPGDKVTVSLSGGTPGATVTVTAKGELDTQVETFEITLDANGKGSHVWVVPAWQLASFTAPGANTETMAIN